MAQKLSGGCACGAIRYECSADPVIMFNCHCRDCQQATGSAYAAIVVVPKTAVQICGEPRYHKVVGKAGKAIERGFCSNCGGQVTVKLERLPDILGLQAGSLEDPSIYRPATDNFTASAQPWIIWIRPSKSTRTECRRGDRITRHFAASHLVRVWHKADFDLSCAMSAFGGKANIAFLGPNVCL